MTRCCHPTPSTSHQQVRNQVPIGIPHPMAFAAFLLLQRTTTRYCTRYGTLQASGNNATNHLALDDDTHARLSPSFSSRSDRRSGTNCGAFRGDTFSFMSCSAIILNASPASVCIWPYASIDMVPFSRESHNETRESLSLLRSTNRGMSSSHHIVQKMGDLGLGREGRTNWQCLSVPGGTI